MTVVPFPVPKPANDAEPDGHAALAEIYLDAVDEAHDRIIEQLFHRDSGRLTVAEMRELFVAQLRSASTSVTAARRELREIKR